MVHRYHTNKKGGGLAMYIANNYDFLVLDELCYSLDIVCE